MAFLHLAFFSDDNLTADLFHSDEENENPGDDLEEVIGSEESQWRMHRLQREEYINSKTEDGNSEYKIFFYYVISLLLYKA